jgi:hypothetical protein
VPRLTVAWPLMVTSLVLLAGGMTPALGQVQFPDSAEQGTTHMDRIDMGSPQPGQTLPPSAMPEEKSPFIRDSRFSAQVRTFYFDRKKFDDSYSEAWTLGGSITYQSGYVADLFRIGAVLYTSQPLYAPDDRDGTLLLKPGQEGYTVLGQAYGEVKFTDRIFGAIGRKEYNTPYINNFDVRMTPNTFEGVTAYGTAGGKDGAPAWRFGGGYISKIKERNSDEFVWMSRAAGASVDRGVYLGGANFEQKKFSIGAINYYSDDIINIFYTEAKYAVPLAGGYKLDLSAQFSDQRSTGDNLLAGQAFSTHQWGLNADLGLGAVLLTLAYTDTADGANMQNPWSGYPGYTSVQVEDFNRAGESAVLVKALYDFSRHGAQGLSAYALWVHGTGVNAPAYNEDEVDLNLQWTPKTGALKNTSFRLRYAHITQRGGGDPVLNDFRFIVNYNF